MRVGKDKRELLAAGGVSGEDEFLSVELGVQSGHKLDFSATLVSRLFCLLVTQLAVVDVIEVTATYFGRRLSSPHSRVITIYIVVSCVASR